MSVERQHFSLDTNILVYAIEAGGGDKAGRAERIVRRAAMTRRCMLSIQCLGEFYHVCARKRRAPPAAAARHAADYGELFQTIAPDINEVRLALLEAASGRLAYWDALLLATVGRAGCGTLLSEDMQDGAAFAGAVVRNPFAGAELPDDLDALLQR